MLHYILQVVAFQFVFLIIYDAFLRKETFFNWNRAYLLVTSLLALFLPFIKINQIKTILPEDFVIQLPQVIIGDLTEANSTPLDLTNLNEISTQTEPFSLWTLLLFGGMCVATLILLFKLIKILNLFYKHPKRWHNDLLIVKIYNSTSAFSFFHYVFLGDRILAKEKTSILAHECVHVRQKHTLDLLFFELLRVAFWFNPLVYMYQNRISELHEFIADAKSVKLENKAEYYNNLLSQVFETHRFSFVTPFFKHSLIKKRILMLSKTKSKQIHMFKYAFLIPLVCAMLIYTSSYAQDNPQKTEKTTKTEDENLSHDQLKKKYYDQIVDMKDSGATFMEINDFAMPDPDKYINSKTAYYKFTAYTQYIMGASEKGKREKNKELPESLKSKMNRTYEDYLAWKHTDEAKETWENNTRDGVLRLIVNDFTNWTDEEKQEMNHKLDMIERDEYFKKLLIVDMKGKAKMILQDPKTPTKITQGDKVIDIEESIEVPFAIVDQVPIMLSCQSLMTNEEQKTCMSQGIAKHVNQNFNTDLAKQIGLSGKLRISVIFKIDKKGYVTDVRARAPHPDLEKEAVRVINLLPQFKPGLQKGKAVTVPYSLPIIFQVKADSKTEKSQKDSINTMTKQVINKISELTEVPFAVVDNAPKYKGCETAANNDEAKKCTSLAVAEFVNKNFNTELAKQLGLSGRNRIAVAFKIGKDGSVFDVKARAPHQNLEAEAIRVIKLIPKFIPGKHKDQLVDVAYSLPIVFQVAP